MSLTVSAARADLYNIMDRVLMTGKPVDVIRNGKTVRIQAAESGSKLARLTPHKCMKVPPEDLVHMDWSHEWKP